MDNEIMLSGKQAVDFARLASLKAMLKLEMVGLKRRGSSAYSILKSDYGFQGNRHRVFEQAQAEVDKQIAEKHAANVVIDKQINAQLKASGMNIPEGV